VAVNVTRPRPRDKSAAAESLPRRLGTGDAVVIGLGSMIGAGVFAAFGPAARAASAGLLIGLVIAAVIAYCNAVASGQLAAAYPTSGGTYIYGRERLGPWWGFAAGWGFVIGKTASCAAMALTVAAYAIPTRRCRILVVLGRTATEGARADRSRPRCRPRPGHP
jgi:APA family basic amino acid/polyamine antiporter